MTARGCLHLDNATCAFCETHSDAPHASGGIVLGPDGEDHIVITLQPGERIFGKDGKEWQERGNADTGAAKIPQREREAPR